MELADNNKRYYWLKLNEDFFNDETIQFIEEQDNGILYSNFYLKLCLKSLKNEGRLMRLVGNSFIPYDVKSLSRLTGVDVDTVRVAMELFKHIGLVEVLDTGEIYMSQINEMIGSETNKAREKRALRARQRERLEASQCDTPVTLSDATVIGCDEEKEIEKELEIDIEKEIKGDKVETMSPRKGDKVETMSPKCLPRDKRIENRDKRIENRDIDKENREVVCTNRVGTSRNSKPSPDDIVNLYNDICISYPQVVRLSEARKKAINARLKKYTLDDFRQLFETAEHNDFLKGANSRNWSATFDWLIADANMAKVLDGNYNSYKSSNFKGQNVKEQQKEEVQEHEQQQCDGIEFEKLDRLIDKGETLDSLRETSIEVYNGLPDWFEAYSQHYNTKYNPDGSEKVQM